jgi:ATP-dependent RNA helicase DeaD
MPSKQTENDNPDRQESNGHDSFRFSDLPAALQKNVERLGWKAPMPVQESIIPLLIDGRDVVVQSRTGSGKTGAFGIPMCMRADADRDDVQGLILVPTRELAEQVFGVVQELTKGLGLRSVAVYGGVGYGPQIEAFRKHVHLVVGTPGRIIDHLTSRRLSLSRLRMLVLDEADEMLSMGFYQSIMKILDFLPKRVQTALLSATLPRGVVNMARQFTHDPETVELSSDILHVEEVEHIYYVEKAMYKDRALLKIIEMENPEAALIFCNTKKEVEYLATFLQNFGYDGAFLSSDLAQSERKKVMDRIRQGQLRFLVATDVAARGIDISDLSLVVLYSLPQAHDHYIHRAGRTGRAGESGRAISLVSLMEEIELKKRAKWHGLQLIKKELPTDEEVEGRVAERLRVMLEEKYRELSQLKRERLRRFIPFFKKLAEMEDMEEVAAMLFDQFYQETLHKPLFVQEEVKKVPAPSSRKHDKGPPRKRGRGGSSRRRRKR